MSTIHDIVVKASFVLKESPCRHARRWLWGGGGSGGFQTGEGYVTFAFEKNLYFVVKCMSG